MGGPTHRILARQSIGTAKEMSSSILREIDLDLLAEEVSNGAAPIVFVTAPNFEDRSVSFASWMRERLATSSENVAVQVLWLQSPGIDDILDRIKADNRDTVADQFKHLGARLAMTRVDLPASDVDVVLNKNRELANMIGGRATLALDFSSLPRTVVRHLLDGVVREQLTDPNSSRYSRIVFLYAAAADYPSGADSDIIGGIVGYFTRRSMHDLISTAGVLEALVSLAGTSHDSAQALDALWDHGLPARTTVSSLAFLNRENFIYSYQRLARATWALKRARETDTELIYAFELGDVIRHVFERTDRALRRHLEYREAGGEGMPTYLIGGFGPKPLGLAALLAIMRYQRIMESSGHAATSDVLQVRGWQYTTRYSQGVGSLKAFEIQLDELYAPLRSADDD